MILSAAADFFVLMISCLTAIKITEASIPMLLFFSVTNANVLGCEFNRFHTNWQQMNWIFLCVTQIFCHFYFAHYSYSVIRIGIDMFVLFRCSNLNQIFVVNFRCGFNSERHWFVWNVINVETLFFCCWFCIQSFVSGWMTINDQLSQLTKNCIVWREQRCGIHWECVLMERVGVRARNTWSTSCGAQKLTKNGKHDVSKKKTAKAIYRIYVT